MDITNPEQLKFILTDITEIVIDDVTERLYNYMMDKIGKYVYSGSNAQYAYGSGYPTGEFAESWQHETKKAGSEIVSTIDQDYSVMSNDPDSFVHGSNYYTNSDARQFIAYYINEGASGPIFGSGPWTNARPFWDETMKLIDNGTVDRWIKQTYKKYGITAI